MTTDTTSVLHFSGRQRLILFVPPGAGFMLPADLSVLNVALPRVGAGVGLALPGLAWITSGYALTTAGFALLFGQMGDLFGHRRLFLSGVILLIGASLAGGYATSAPMLQAARVLQGFATAMAVPAALSLLMSSLHKGPMRDRVLGLNGALLSGGFHRRSPGRRQSCRPELAGRVLHQHPGRRGHPAATPVLISETSSPGREKLDVPGAVTGGLPAVIYAVIERNLVSAAAGVELLPPSGGSSCVRLPRSPRCAS